MLNILIALYNSAYEDITGNADDEYLALLAQKTMQFVRAPDENVFVPPLNLVEIVISALFEWWMPKRAYELLNDVVMAILYSPLLVVAAYVETRKAREIRSNRARGEDDDDEVQEWEQMASHVDFESEGWVKTCESVKPNVEEEPAVIEVKKLRNEIEELRAMLSEITQAVGAGSTVSQKTLGGKEDSQQKSQDKGQAGSSSSGTE